MPVTTELCIASCVRKVAWLSYHKLAELVEKFFLVAFKEADIGSHGYSLPLDKLLQIHLPIKLWLHLFNKFAVVFRSFRQTAAQADE